MCAPGGLDFVVLWSGQIKAVCLSGAITLRQQKGELHTNTTGSQYFNRKGDDNLSLHEYFYLELKCKKPDAM